MDKKEDRRAYFFRCQQQLQPLQANRRESPKRSDNVEGVPHVFLKEARLQQQLCAKS